MYIVRGGGVLWKINKSGLSRKAGFPGYNSGSELGREPVRVRDYWPAAGIAWVGTRDACAIVKPHSYPPAKKKTPWVRQYESRETVHSPGPGPLSDFDRRWLQPRRKLDTLRRAHDIG